MSFHLDDNLPKLGKIYSSNQSCKSNSANNLGNSLSKFKTESLELQIIHLKDKAHQSFMQVIQMQELHDEELVDLQKDFEEKEINYKREISNLKNQLALAKSEKIALQKNIKGQNCDLSCADLFLSSIDPISSEQNQNSYLDESEFNQFQDLINTKNSSDDLQLLRQEIYKDITHTSISKLKIDKLFRIITEFMDEKTYLQMDKEKLQKEKIQLQKTIQNWKNTANHWQQQTNFLSDHVKKLSKEKLQLQKKTKELSMGRTSQTSSPQIMRLFSPKSNTMNTMTYTKSMVKSQCPSQNDSAVQKEGVKHPDLLKLPNKTLFSSKSEISKLGSIKFVMPQLNGNKDICKDSIQSNLPFQCSS